MRFWSTSTRHHFLFKKQGQKEYFRILSIKTSNLRYLFFGSYEWADFKFKFSSSAMAKQQQNNVLYHKYWNRSRHQNRDLGKLNIQVPLDDCLRDFYALAAWPTVCTVQFHSKHFFMTQSCYLSFCFFTVGFFFTSSYKTD